MTKKYQLESIDVDSPCSESWKKMKGSHEKRFCGSCEKDVYNLSAMSRRQANLLLRKSGGRICVRFAKLPNGRVATIERPRYQISRRAGVAAGVLATAMSLSTLAYSQGSPSISRNTAPSPSNETAPAVADQVNPVDSEELSQISLTVLDRTGASIPGALVKFVGEDTKQIISAFSGPDGNVDFGALRKTRYKVTVELAGFQSYSRYKRISLPVEPNLEIVLDFGIVTGLIVDDSYEIPVFDAIAQNRTEDFEAAIRSGFDINLEGTRKQTALHVAVDHVRVGIVKTLLESGAGVNAKTSAGATPLLSLSEDFGEDDDDVTKILRLLISHGADLDVQDEDSKETALMNAAYYDDPEAVEILLTAGADASLKDEDEETAYKKIEDERIREIFHRYGVFN